MKGKGKDASTSIALIRESMAAVLRLVEAEEEEGLVDIQCMSKAKEIVEPATESTRSLKVPEWARSNVRFNLLGTMPFTRCHHFAAARVEEAMVEWLVDTGGARTVADKHTIAKMGLKIEYGDFGSFWGLGAGPTSYLGRVPGPIIIQFSEEVSMWLPEIKVIDTDEPLLILGNDLLAPE